MLLLGGGKKIKQDFWAENHRTGVGQRQAIMFFRPSLRLGSRPPRSWPPSAGKNISKILFDFFAPTPQQPSGTIFMTIAFAYLAAGCLLSF
jgi:hypothetical protein